MGLQQLVFSFESPNGVVIVRLGLSQLGARLFDLFKAKTVHHFAIAGLGLGYLSFSEMYLVLIRAIVEYSDQVSCLHDITFLRFHLFQPAAHSKAQVDLTDINVAIDNQFIWPGSGELPINQPAGTR